MAGAMAEVPIDYCADFALRQPIDGKRGHMRLSDPGRLDLAGSWS